MAESVADVVELNGLNCCKIVMKPGPLGPERQLINKTDTWHKFIIIGGSKYFKDFLLKLVIDAAYPFCLIPVKYMTQDPDTFFYGRDCSGAIDKLCRAGLVIANPQNPRGENLQLRILLASASLSEIQVNVKNSILRVLAKRYNQQKSVLNLNDFHNDADLKDVFCPLSRPRILNFVLSLAVTTTSVTSIQLAHNELVILKPLEILRGFKKLRILNLGHNKIPRIDELEVLKQILLLELVVDDNPLCQAFDDEVYYSFRIREYAPKLRRLDGVLLSVPGTPQPRRNFLVIPETGPLVDQFIEHYFNLYDSDNRKNLYGMYHDDATVSMTATYIPGETSLSSTNLRQYMISSRNLLKISDYSKIQPLLFTGQDSILSLYCRLPSTDHDPYTFTVDVAFYTAKTVSVNVTGVFRETNGLIRTFSRVFVLVCVLPNEWQICNEMVNISNASADIASQSFKIKRPPIVQRVSQITDRDKEEMIELLMNLTDMKSEWSKKCLEDMKWDFKEAVVIFTHMYKLGQIPEEAFEVKKKK